MNLKNCGLLALVAFLAVISFVLSISLGAVSLPLQELLPFAERSDATSTILFSLRLPRSLLAAGVGMLLAVCGCVSQGLFRNPLADPSLIGVSAGASLGASIAIVFISKPDIHWLGLSAVTFCAFGGAMLTVVLVYRFAQTDYGTSVSTMLLAGIGITFIAGSCTSFLEFIADHQMLRQLSLWRMGGLEGANFIKVVLIAVVAALVLPVVWLHAHALDAFLLGESEARHLGVAVDRAKRWLIICIAAGVGVSVAFAGTIAFVGLVVPHMVRALVGPQHHWLLPLSALLGAILLMLADVLSRTVLAPVELPVGLIISLLGAPLFLFLLRQRYQYHG